MRRIALSLFAASVISPAFAAGNLSGNWQFDGDVDGHPVVMSCALVQDGTKLTGKCKSTELGEWTISGEVNDQKVTLTYSVNYQGTDYTLNYAGTIDSSAASLNGHIDVGGASGVFTAKKE
jgi:hypothetical protein